MLIRATYSYAKICDSFQPRLIAILPSDLYEVLPNYLFHRYMITDGTQNIIQSQAEDWMNAIC